MNWVDLSLLAFAVLAFVSGVREGLSRSGFGLLALGAAFLTAAWMYPAKPAGFVVVFVLGICAAAALAKALGKWFRASGLNWLDRALGGAFGVVNACLFAIIALVGLMAFAPKAPRHYVAHSAVAPYALDAARGAAATVPDEMKSRVESAYQELLSTLPPGARKKAPAIPRSL